MSERSVEPTPQPLSSAGEDATVLKQEIDYLGYLANQLRDLQGTETLAHELVQNADDAPNVSELVFDVRSDMLIVRNDGSFRDEDFDRLRRVSGRGKREEEGTTGAFGIGFVSVFQLTDRPSIRSSGRRWTLFPELDGRIESTADDTGGTTVFEFPWAKDPSSKVRTTLGIQAIDEAWMADFETRVANLLPDAILFLRKLNAIELRRRDGTQLRVERRIDGHTYAVNVNGALTSYRVWTGDFGAAEGRLRSVYGPLLEEKRKSRVQVAVRHGGLPELGRLYAYLPTQVTTKIGLHIQADFFPSQNRRDIPLGSDYVGEWNRAAFDFAGELVSDRIIELRDLLGHVSLWHLIERASSEHADSTGRLANHVWLPLKTAIVTSPVLLTTDGEWVVPTRAFLLTAPDKYSDLLRELELPTVHADLRTHHNLLQHEIGTRSLNLRILLDAVEHSLATVGSGRRDWRSHDALRDQLHELIDELHKGNIKDERLRTLPFVALADESFGQAAQAVSADDRLRRVLIGVGLANRVSAEPIGRFATLLTDAKASLAVLLRSVPTDQWVGLAGDRVSMTTLREWLADNLEVVRTDPALVMCLRELPIWPVGSSMSALDGAVRPGDFEDPLGLANVVDVTQLPGCDGLLDVLDVERLTFDNYVVHQVPRAFVAERPPGLESCRHLRHLLAMRLGALLTIPRARTILRTLSFIECTDGIVRTPEEVYLPGGAGLALLDNPAEAVLPDDGGATREFLRWAGVESEPRLEALAARVRHWTQIHEPSEGRQFIQDVLRHLGYRFREAGRLPDDLSSLRLLPWLPAMESNNEWWKPAEVFMDFRRSIFASSGRFIDFPYNDQRSARAFLVMLGVQIDPPIALVVAHLRKSVLRKHAVGQDVYQELGDHASDSEVKALRNIACIWCEAAMSYQRPEQVFFLPVAFGRFAVFLDVPDARAKKFFEAVGVRPTPDSADGARVLRQLSTEYKSRELDDEAWTVSMACWKLIGDGNDVDSLASSLYSERVVPNRNRLLCTPAELLFEDRALVVDRFGTHLLGTVIDLHPGAIYRAMTSAGVRRLSEVLDIELVEEVDAVAAPDLEARLEDRKSLMFRVCSAFEWVTSPQDLLGGLKVFETQRIEVVQKVRLFVNQIPSAPFAQAALLRDSKLFVVRSSSEMWLTVATELAGQLVAVPADAGKLASLLTAVLEAKTRDQASSRLDRYGVPPDAAGIPESPVSPTTGFTDDGPHEAGDGAESRTGGSKQSDRAAPSNGSAPGDKPPRAGGSATSGGGAPAPHETQVSGGSVEAGVGEPTARPATSSPDRLRSYVSRGVAPDRGSDAGDNAMNLEVDRRGCDAVLAFERAHGRDPEKMDHLQRGFDIRSEDVASGAVRFIEVKSRRGEWTAQGVGLSSAQYEFLEGKSASGWLYVVENAMTDNPVVHAIPDPIGRITQYFFDDGWREAVESRDRKPTDLSGPAANSSHRQ